jgi:hypothetical protein
VKQSSCSCGDARIIDLEHPSGVPKAVRVPSPVAGPVTFEEVVHQVYSSRFFSRANPDLNDFGADEYFRCPNCGDFANEFTEET